VSDPKIFVLALTEAERTALQALLDATELSPPLRSVQEMLVAALWEVTSS
jgi:hypothetical protein